MNKKVTNYPHSFRTTNKFKLHESVCKDHNYCHVKIREINKHTVCGCSLLTYSFDSNKNKHDFLQRNVTKDKEVRYNTKTAKTIKPQI